MGNTQLEILQEAANYGIIDMAKLKETIKMRKKERILSNHKFEIYQGKDGRWRTSLPDNNDKKGKTVKKTKYEDLLDVLIDFYDKREELEAEERGPTFKECYDEWRLFYDQLAESQNTVYKYNTDYARFLKDTEFEQKPIKDITEDELALFFHDTIVHYKGQKGADRLTYKSFERLYGYVQKTFKRAVKRRIVSPVDNPMEYIEKKDFQRYCRVIEKTAETELISDEHFNLLLDRLYKDMKEQPEYLAPYAVELGALTGMRVAELAALKWSDIDYRNGVITIRRSDKYDRIHKVWSVEENTKTKKTRRFPIDTDIERSLNRIKKVQMRYGMVSEWIFPHAEYGWMHSSLISDCIKAKCKQIGLSRTYGIHAFRKTLNSDMRNQGASDVICSGMLGHSVQVNNQYYTYDNSRMDIKNQYVSEAHKKRKFS